MEEIYKTVRRRDGTVTLVPASQPASPYGHLSLSDSAGAEYPTHVLKGVTFAAAAAAGHAPHPSEFLDLPATTREWEKTEEKQPAPSAPPPLPRRAYAEERAGIQFPPGAHATNHRGEPCSLVSRMMRRLSAISVSKTSPSGRGPSQGVLFRETAGGRIPYVKRLPYQRINLFLPEHYQVYWVLVVDKYMEDHLMEKWGDVEDRGGRSYEKAFYRTYSGLTANRQQRGLSMTNTDDCFIPEEIFLLMQVILLDEPDEIRAGRLRKLEDLGFTTIGFDVYHDWIRLLRYRVQSRIVNHLPSYGICQRHVSAANPDYLPPFMYFKMERQKSREMRALRDWEYHFFAHL